MSEQVKRYDIDDGKVSCNSEGDYVRHSDHATLQAECERFERELSSLGESLIESMRENAKLRVECERLREQVAALQSDENSYQSGFIAGRKSVQEFAKSWRKEYEQAKAECERLHAEVLRLTPNPADFRYREGRYRDEASANDALRAKLAAIKVQHQETVYALKSCAWALVHNPSCQRGVIQNCRCRDCALAQAGCAIATTYYQN